MASSLPIPAPPRTPTPPTPIPEEPDEGLGIDGTYRTVRSTLAFDPNALSPIVDTFPGRFGSMASPMPSSAGLSTPSLSSDGTMPPPPPPGGQRGPFNFQTQAIKDSPVMANSNIGKRRGHRYKHSSVSTQHQIFTEPPPRAPLALPASLQIPQFN
jgi:hypothetical protein